MEWNAEELLKINIKTYLNDQSQNSFENPKRCGNEKLFFLEGFMKPQRKFKHFETTFKFIMLLSLLEMPLKHFFLVKCMKSFENWHKTQDKSPVLTKTN